MMAYAASDRCKESEDGWMDAIKSKPQNLLEDNRLRRLICLICMNPVLSSFLHVNIL